MSGGPPFRPSALGGIVTLAVTRLRLIPVVEYGFAPEAQPRSTALANGTKRADKMDTWGLCIGSIGRAQGPAGLHQSAVTDLT